MTFNQSLAFVKSKYPKASMFAMTDLSRCKRKRRYLVTTNEGLGKSLGHWGGYKKQTKAWKMAALFIKRGYDGSVEEYLAKSHLRAIR